MPAHSFRAAPAGRFELEPPGLGGPLDAASPAQTAPASSASSNPLDAVSGALQGFLANGVDAAQVGLGLALLAVALLMLVSQTSAGAAAGKGAAGAARRGLRLIPGVGAIA